MNTQISEASPDSWALTDSCRLLANALVNPQNNGAQDKLCLMLQTQLINLEIALREPIPEHRKNMGIPLDDGLFDYTDAEPEELCDQCSALNFALLTLHDKRIKEILAFVLCERFEMLRCALYADSEELAA